MFKSTRYEYEFLIVGFIYIDVPQLGLGLV